MRERSRARRSLNLSGRDLLLFRARRNQSRLAGRVWPPGIMDDGGTDMNVAAQAFERISDQPFGKRPNFAELKVRIANVSSQIKARAHTTEKSGRVPAENILALREIGYFDIVKPRAFGGYEYDFDVLVELNIDLARACASTAWVGGLPPAPQWAISRFPEQAQRDVWGSNPDALACGSYAPATKAVASNGGLSLPGRRSLPPCCAKPQRSPCAALRRPRTAT